MRARWRPDIVDRLLWVALLSGLLVISCGQREVELTGSVFVVTKGGESVKLGLVHVTAIPEDAVREFIGAKVAAGEQGQAELRPLLDDCEREYNEAKAAWDLAKVQSAAALERYVDNPGSSGLDQAWYADSERLEASLVAYLGKSSALEALRPAYSYWTSGGYYLDGLPDGAASAKTDANGEFSLRLAAGKRYALAAAASRQILDETESYHWLVWVTPGKDAGSVMLSNDNLVTSGSPESVVAASE